MEFKPQSNNNVLQYHNVQRPEPHSLYYILSQNNVVFRVEITRTG